MPFSFIYGFIIWLRNKLFDYKILRSASFNFPLICVGNLAVGGTGKTPMAEYLIRMLETKYQVATLSRGYKRKTKGFAIANENTTAIEIGDEPMQLHKKFPGITVAVAEERIVGIPQLLHDKPGTQVIILDDAFQHREVRAGLNILLSECENLYPNDTMLPAGDLRDVKSSSKRANIIIVTKCKSHITEEEKDKITGELMPLESQKVFFTTIEYASPYHLFTKEVKPLESGTDILLVCGIANPGPLKELFASYSDTFEVLVFEDHHIFSTDDLGKIKTKFSKMAPGNKMIVTTEKDGVRLAKYENELKDLPVYVLPMRHKFLFAGEDQFATEIISFVESYRDNYLPAG